MPKQPGVRSGNTKVVLFDPESGEDGFNEFRPARTVSRIGQLDTDKQLGCRDGSDRHVVIILNNLIPLPIPTLRGDEDCGVQDQSLHR